MILPSIPGWRRAGSVRAARQAFTLMELLAVMTIILLLAGLILNIAGNAQHKSAVARATAEVKQMETAMESYKVDNGTYPRDPTTSIVSGQSSSTTDTLNAQTSNDPASTTTPTYIAASTFLFDQLSGNTEFLTNSASGGALSKAYITFLPGQLANSDGTQVSAGVNKSTYIIDPFGFSYGYSTYNQAAQDNLNTNGVAIPANAGYNPTFDLWSTGGYSTTSGKPYPGTLTSTQYNTLWAKNW